MSNFAACDPAARAVPAAAEFPGASSDPVSVGTPQPTIGVIMAARDAEDYIAEALASLTAQTYPAWECIVVDDASTDATATIAIAAAANDDRIRVLSQPHGGVSAARNTGLAALSASVDFVAFLDGDDTYLPNALQSLLQVLEQRPDAVGVYGLAEYMDENGTPSRPGEHSARQLARRAVHNKTVIDLDRDADSTFADISLAGAIWPSAVALHRRSVLDAVGHFDVSFTRQGDWDLYIRMSRRGPYAVMGEQVAWYRRHGANLTGNIVESCYQQERVRHKAWTTPGNTAEQRRILIRGHSECACRGCEKPSIAFPVTCRHTTWQLWPATCEGRWQSPQP